MNISRMKLYSALFIIVFILNAYQFLMLYSYFSRGYSGFLSSPFGLTGLFSLLLLFVGAYYSYYEK